MLDENVKIQQVKDVTSGDTWLSSYVTDCEDSTCEWRIISSSVFNIAHHI